MEHYYDFVVPRLKFSIYKDIMLYDFQGRGFNVQINYAEEPVQDYVQAAVSTTLLIHQRVLYLIMG